DALPICVRRLDRRPDGPRRLRRLPGHALSPLSSRTDLPAMRYLPLTPDDRSAMLAAIGAKSIDDLFVDVPQAARRDGFVDLPRVAGELEVERTLGAMAGKNVAAGA